MRTLHSNFRWKLLSMIKIVFGFSSYARTHRKRTHTHTAYISCCQMTFAIMDVDNWFISDTIHPTSYNLFWATTMTTDRNNEHLKSIVNTNCKVSTDFLTSIHNRIVIISDTNQITSNISECLRRMDLLCRRMNRKNPEEIDSDSI